MAKIAILDHGYLELVETWGSDERIIEAARMSTGKGFKNWGPVFRCRLCELEFPERSIDPANVSGYKCKDGSENHSWDREQSGDEKLLRRLWTLNHATPFEMGGAIIEVQAPIMVFREWHRHRTQSYNEMSARYTPLPDLSYVPTTERLLRGQGTANKQAGTVKDSEILTPDVADGLMVEEREFNAAAERFYQKKLRAGVPKELARTHIGVSRYSRMRASANLRNWLAFLTLRDHDAAQWEIREYARRLHDVLVEKFPRTMSLFDEKR